MEKAVPMKEAKEAAETGEQDEVLELNAELVANRALSKTNGLNCKFSAPVARPIKLLSPVKCLYVAPTG